MSTCHIRLSATSHRGKDIAHTHCMQRDIERYSCYERDKVIRPERYSYSYSYISKCITKQVGEVVTFASVDGEIREVKYKYTCVCQ